MPAERRLVATDRGQVVGHLGVSGLGQSYGGRVVPMGGVAGVAVAPTHRRAGVGSALLRAALAGMRARGEHLSTLYPMASTPYRRSGWEVAGTWLRRRVPVRSLTTLPRPEVAHRFAPVSDDDLPAMTRLHDEVSRHHPGRCAASASPVAWSGPTTTTSATSPAAATSSPATSGTSTPRPPTAVPPTASRCTSWSGATATPCWRCGRSGLVVVGGLHGDVRVAAGRSAAAVAAGGQRPRARPGGVAVDDASGRRARRDRRPRIPARRRGRRAAAGPRPAAARPRRRRGPGGPRRRGPARAGGRRPRAARDRRVREPLHRLVEPLDAGPRRPPRRRHRRRPHRPHRRLRRSDALDPQLLPTHGPGRGQPSTGRPSRAWAMR